MTHKLALDTNCIIDLEEDRPNAVYIRALIGAWKSGQIELAVIAVSASENQTSGAASRDFSVFDAKLNHVGLSGVYQLLPMMIWDVFYWDHALWSSDEMISLESELRSVLFPNIQTVPPANIVENSVWRNRMCDVLVAWSCIYHNWNNLVTSDRNFHDHATKLKKLGLQEVLYAKEAARLYTR